MSRFTLLGRRRNSPDDAKIIATQLRNALEEVGVLLPPTKLLEVVAQLCGAQDYDDLRHRLKDAPQSEPTAPSSEARLLSLPEFLLLRKPEGDGPLVGQLQFWDKDSGPHWCYAVGADAIKPAALEAARRLVLGLPLRPTDSKWVSGRSREASVIDAEKAGGTLKVDTRALAGAAYLGEGKWSVGSNYHCRLSVNDPLLIERHSVLVSPKALADEALAARRFAPPPDFAAAGFEVYTVNIEARLMLRCLALSDPGRVLDSLRLVGQRWPPDFSDPAVAPHRLRAAMLRADASGGVQVVRVTGRKEGLLAAMSWDGTQWSGIRDPTAVKTTEQRGSSRRRVDYSGEDGLTRIWQDIRHWIMWCESRALVVAGQLPPAPQRSFQEFLLEVADAKSPLSLTRRAEMEKWLAGGRAWEQQPDKTEAIASEPTDGLS
jgi:hypothetical protein